jgi:hypothetical protein
MFAFPDVVHLLAHELARLTRGRFAFALRLSRALNSFSFWHIDVPQLGPTKSPTSALCVSTQTPSPRHREHKLSYAVARTTLAFPAELIDI